MPIADKSTAQYRCGEFEGMRSKTELRKSRAVYDPQGHMT
jgi:hypothetical protein